MKKALFIGLSFVTLLCTAQTISPKRGVGLMEPASEAKLNTLKKGCSWYYNWSDKSLGNFGESIEYVPMIWTFGSKRAPATQAEIDEIYSRVPTQEQYDAFWAAGPTQEEIDAFYANIPRNEDLEALWDRPFSRTWQEIEDFKAHGTDALDAYIAQHPSIKYILAFNEPNFKDQACLSPKAAAAAWPGIEKVAKKYNLKIVGPALNFSPDAPYNDPVKWYEDFFAACPDCQVDYIALHFYMPNLDGLRGALYQFYKFNKPIWLTEFNYSLDGYNDTMDKQIEYAQECIEWLENEPMIFRYAWFLAYHTESYCFILSNPKEAITDLGKIYLGMSSYDSNHYFNINENIPAEHYISKNNITLSAIPNSNDIQLECLGNSTINYQINIKKAGTYYFNVNAACRFDNATLTISKNEKNITTIPIKKTGNMTKFDTSTQEIDLPKGKYTITLKSNKAFYLNWLSISDSPENIVGCERESFEKIKIYPSIISDIATIDFEGNIDEVMVYNLSGKLEYQISNTKEINLSHLDAGNYLIICKSGDKYYNQTIVKQ